MDGLFNSQNESVIRKKNLDMLQVTYNDYIKEYEGIFVNSLQQTYTNFQKNFVGNLSQRLGKMANLESYQRLYFQEVGFFGFSTLCIDILNTLVLKDDNQSIEHLKEQKMDK